MMKSRFEIKEQWLICTTGSFGVAPIIIEKCNSKEEALKSLETWPDGYFIIKSIMKVAL